MTDTILIIDDEPLHRLNLRSLLEDLDFQVVDAGDGPSGLAVCAAASPDLVLLDIRMPGMDGLEVCARLHEDPATRDIPVIILSGAGEAAEKVRALRAGAVDYVTKPFHLEEVEARVATHLSLRRQRRILEDTLRRSEVLNARLVEVNERLKRSEDLKGHFLAHMRNEINNPLSTVLAIGAQMASGALAPEQVQQLGRVLQREAQTLDFKLENIFMAAELEAGEAFPAPAEVALDDLVREVLGAFEEEARAKEVTLDWEGAGEDTVHADPAKLRILLANLVSNAVKFGAPASRVQVRARRGDDVLDLEVTDEGPGIAREDQAKVFERFTQLETGLDRAHGGEGLGLSIVKALVDLLGGTLALDSAPGRGCTFRVSLPVLPEGGLDAAFGGNLTFFEGGEEA